MMKQCPDHQDFFFFLLTECYGYDFNIQLLRNSKKMIPEEHGDLFADKISGEIK